ncbi:MAG: hypothetical protein VX828_06655, partial [Candidatus Thermoplasmatota archaeon]|nr:hypothetical protein [Candidatus Thermoplasmatota archaeon]
WSWNSIHDGAFGWFDGHHLQQNTPLSQWAVHGNPVDQGVVLHAEEDITWTWANGVEDSLDSGQYRILEYPVSSIQNQSVPSDFTFIGMAISWETIDSVTGLGSTLRAIQSDAINGTGPASITAGELQIPIVMQADIGGISLTGSISHAQRIVNEIDSVPSGTMVPEQNITIVSTHTHLFDRNLLDVAILRLQSSTGIDIEVHVEDLSTEPVATQIFGAQYMALSSVTLTTVGDMGLQLYWNFQTQWAFDDADIIEVLSEAIEVDGFTLGPASSTIGGSNHQAMENDLEIVSWQVRDEQSRLLSNEWDARYPLHAKSGSTISVTGTVRFEGQAATHPAPNAYTVGLELNGTNGTLQSIGTSGESGAFSVFIQLPNGSDHVTVSPWILQIGPLGVPIFGAEDASAGELLVEVKTDPNPPKLGP